MFFIILCIALAIMIANMNNNYNHIIKGCFFDTENNKIHAFLNDNSYYYGEYKLTANGDCVLYGAGKVLFKDNSSFIGYFQNNLRHGVGIYYYNNNSIFRERIHNYSYGDTLMNDDFYLSYKEGRYFVGQYYFNSSITNGTMFYTNGTTKFGNYSFISFVNGSMVEIFN